MNRKQQNEHRQRLLKARLIGSNPITKVIVTNRGEKTAQINKENPSSVQKKQLASVEMFGGVSTTAGTRQKLYGMASIRCKVERNSVTLNTSIQEPTKELTLYKTTSGNLQVVIRNRQKKDEVVNFGKWQVKRCVAQRIKEGLMTFMIDKNLTEELVAEM